jgi:hypothetical protein
LHRPARLRLEDAGEFLEPFNHGRRREIGTISRKVLERKGPSSAQRAGIAWNILTAVGIPGVLDIYADPITCGINTYIKIRRQYQAQPKQIAAALWGAGAGQGRYLYYGKVAGFCHFQFLLGRRTFGLDTTPALAVALVLLLAATAVGPEART